MNSPTKYFRLNDYYLNRSLPILVDKKGKEIDIEQKVWLLLKLFCQHDQQVISRNQIIEQVYAGAVISDNAVNKLVAKARKLLADTPNAPTYIKTFSKQGYSLIADVEESNDIHFQAQISIAPSQKSNATKNISSLPISNRESNTAKLITYFVALLLILVIGYMSYQGFGSSNGYYINQKLSPLTRSIGVEASPNLSHDGQFLIYRKNSPKNKLFGWWIKDIGKEQIERNLPIKNLSSPITWSANKNEFLYVAQDNSCEIHRMSVSEQQISSTEVAQCGTNIVKQLVYSKEEDGVYLVMRPNMSAPWQIHYLNFTNNEMTLINQPTPSGIGNYAVDLSPDKAKLLILSANSTQTTSLNVLNTETQEISLQGQRDWLLNRVIWHHDSQRLIHTSQRYARELLISNFKGNEQSTLISTSKRILDNFMRHPNGVDYYFTSFQMNNDITQLTAEGDNSRALDNTDVYEKLPVYIGNGDQWFFVSNRKNISQIYLYSSKIGSSRQVSFFNEEYQFTSLDVSLDGRLLAFHEQNRLIIYTPDTKRIRTYLSPQGQIIASNWLSNDQLSISITNGGNIRAYIFDLKTEKFEQVSQSWSVIFAGQTPSDLYAVNSTNQQVFIVDQNFKTIKELPLTVQDTVTHSGLQFKATDNAIIHLKHDGAYSSINRFDLQDLKNTELGSWLYIEGFDAINNHVIFSYERNRSGDIMLSHLRLN